MKKIMVQNLLKTMYKYVVDQEELKRQKMYQERYNKLNKEYYDKEMQYATNLFNRNYYRNYLDTPVAQRMLKQVRDMLGEQTRSLRNTSTVMGLTGESLAAMQKSNNKALDNMVGTLSNADVQEKERALFNYDKVRSKLDNFMFNVRMDDTVKQNAFDEQDVQNKLNAISPYIEAFLSMSTKKRGRAK
jgi:DNA-binding ferritin-like protein (Dps family)